jgi:hypothetical protein
LKKSFFPKDDANLLRLSDEMKELTTLLNNQLQTGIVDREAAKEVKATKKHVSFNNDSTF